MQVLNGPGGGDIHEKAKSMIQRNSNKPEQHDFFSPLNEMDPMVRKTKTVVMPKFNFKVFFLSGADQLTVEEDSKEYLRVMTEVTEGRYQMVEEKDYHTKEGEIKIFLKWLEHPITEKNRAELSAIPDFKAKKNKKNKKSYTPKKKIRDYTEDPISDDGPELTL